MRFVKSHTSLLLLTVMGTVSSARADYVLTPLEAGTEDNLVQVAPGGTFAVDFVLTSNANNVHNSNVFRPTLSQEGLILLGYQWKGGYQNASGPGNTNDDSTPNVVAKTDGRPQTPTAIVDTSFGPDNSPIDVNMTNVLDDGTFGVGTLVTLNFQLPSNWTGANTISLTAVPDSFTNGFTAIPTTSGPPLTISVIPEPASLGLMGLLGAGVLLRRRRAM